MGRLDHEDMQHSRRGDKTDPMSKWCHTEIKDVKVGDKPEDYLHTLIAGGNESDNDHAVVWMPGALCLWKGSSGRNFDGLRPWKIFGVDWWGQCLSGRPKFTAQTREEAEDFFLESLQEWRKSMGLNKFVLCGHSLGGMDTALRYPEHVSHLVLVCPAGVPKAPENWAQNFTEKLSYFGKGMVKLAGWAWDRGTTPGSVIRALGPWGPNIVKGYVNNRFTQHGVGISPEEAGPFASYFYHISSAPGSGEFALRHLLAPGAWAHEPLEKRLRDLKLCKELLEERQPKAVSDWTVSIIKESGHYAFVEQPAKFNEALLEAIAYLRNLKSLQESSKCVGAQVAQQHSKGQCNGFLKRKAPGPCVQTQEAATAPEASPEEQARGSAGAASYTDIVTKLKGVQLKGGQQRSKFWS
eukprot:gene5310-18555_t